MRSNNMGFATGNGLRFRTSGKVDDGTAEDARLRLLEAREDERRQIPATCTM